jgi:hypothetical protein
MIREYLKEYIDIWKSFFDIEKVTEKKYFNVFVCINFLCILIICKVSEFSEIQSFINGITILLFAVTLIFAAIKSGIPKITGKLFGKIVLTAILVGFMNALIVLGHTDLDSQGYGEFIMIAICITVYPIIVMISILFFNLFKKEKISDLELIIYFAILLVITIIQTQSIIDESTG